MFGRDVYIPTIANLIQPKLGYLGGMSSLLLNRDVKIGLCVSKRQTTY